MVKNNRLVNNQIAVLATTPAMAPLWQYLHNSQITITDRDGSLAGFWRDHATNDPIMGTCPHDLTSESLGNHLFYNDVEVGTERATPDVANSAPPRRATRARLVCLGSARSPEPAVLLSASSGRKPH